MPNYRDAVRRSFLAKLAVWLQSADSRNLPEYVSLLRNGETLTFDAAAPNQSLYSTEYAIVEIQRGEAFHMPGVNVRFLDESDLTRARTKRKDLRLPVVIYVLRDLSGNISPNVLATETSDVMARIIKCLEDGEVPIWDFSPTGQPYYTGHKGDWHGRVRPNPGYSFRDESFAVEAGYVGQSLTLHIDYRIFD